MGAAEPWACCGGRVGAVVSAASVSFRFELGAGLLALRERVSLNALSLMLEAADSAAADVAAGASWPVAFADAYLPTRETAAVARRMGLGLGVDRGRWVVLV